MPDAADWGTALAVVLTLVIVGSVAWLVHEFRTAPLQDPRVQLYATRDQLARIAEITIGIGVDPVAGCKFCDRDDPPCPVHLGEAIADEILKASVSS